MRNQVCSPGVRTRANETASGHLPGVGPGADQRVGLSCQESMIIELRIGPRGQPGEMASLYELMRASKPIVIGCGGRRVALPGLNPP